jgi:plastocyanin
MTSLHRSIGSRHATLLGIAALLLLTLTLLVAACGGGSSATTTTVAPGTTATTAPTGTTATTAAPGSTTTASSTTGGGNEVQVIMTNRSYDPETVTIKVGDTVTWVNQDAPQHDVVADNGEFKSDLFDKGQSFSHTFTAAGTYPYHCSIHPGMTGTVIVE